MTPPPPFASPALSHCSSGGASSPPMPGTPEAPGSPGAAPLGLDTSSSSEAELGSTLPLFPKTPPRPPRAARGSLRPSSAVAAAARALHHHSFGDAAVPLDVEPDNSDLPSPVARSDAAEGPTSPLLQALRSGAQPPSLRRPRERESSMPSSAGSTPSLASADSGESWHTSGGTSSRQPPRVAAPAGAPSAVLLSFGSAGIPSHRLGSAPRGGGRRNEESADPAVRRASRRDGGTHASGTTPGAVPNLNVADEGGAAPLAPAASAVASPSLRPRLPIDSALCARACAPRAASASVGPLDRGTASSRSTSSPAPYSPSSADMPVASSANGAAGAPKAPAKQTSPALPPVGNPLFAAFNQAAASQSTLSLGLPISPLLSARSLPEPAPRQKDAQTGWNKFNVGGPPVASPAASAVSSPGAVANAQPWTTEPLNTSQPSSQSAHRASSGSEAASGGYVSCGSSSSHESRTGGADEHSDASGSERGGSSSNLRERRLRTRAEKLLEAGEELPPTLAPTLAHIDTDLAVPQRKPANEKRLSAQPTARPAQALQPEVPKMPEQAPDASELVDAHDGVDTPATALATARRARHASGSDSEVQSGDSAASHQKPAAGRQSAEEARGQPSVPDDVRFSTDIRPLPSVPDGVSIRSSIDSEAPFDDDEDAELPYRAGHKRDSGSSYASGRSLSTLDGEGAVLVSVVKRVPAKTIQRPAPHGALAASASSPAADGDRTLLAVAAKRAHSRSVGANDAPSPAMPPRSQTLDAPTDAHRPPLAGRGSSWAPQTPETQKLIATQRPRTSESESATDARMRFGAHAPAAAHPRLPSSNRTSASSAGGSDWDSAHHAANMRNLGVQPKWAGYRHPNASQDSAVSALRMANDNGRRSRAGSQAHPTPAPSARQQQRDSQLSQQSHSTHGSGPSSNLHVRPSTVSSDGRSPGARTFGDDSTDRMSLSVNSAWRAAAAPIEPAASHASSAAFLSMQLEEPDIDLVVDESRTSEETSLYAVRRRLVETYPTLGSRGSAFGLGRGLHSRKSIDASEASKAAGFGVLVGNEKDARKREEAFEAREREITIEAICKDEVAVVKIEIWTEARSGRWIVRGPAPPHSTPVSALPEIADPWGIPIDAKGIVRRRKLKSNVEMSSTRTVVRCIECAEARDKGIGCRCHTCGDSRCVEMVYVVQCVVRLAQFLPLKLPTHHITGAKQPGVKYLDSSEPAYREAVLRDRAIDGLQAAAGRVGRQHHAEHGSRLLMGKATITRKGLLTVAVTNSKGKGRRTFQVEDGVDGNITELELPVKDGSGGRRASREHTRDSGFSETVNTYDSMASSARAGSPSSSRPSFLNTEPDRASFYSGAPSTRSIAPQSSRKSLRSLFTR